MPTLIGRLEQDARAAADSAGLTITEVIYVESEFGEPGGVVGQEPPPGAGVRPGSDVQLRVTRTGSRETTRAEPEAASGDLAGLMGSTDERSTP